MRASPSGATAGFRHLAAEQFDNVLFVHVRRAVPDLASCPRLNGKRIVTKYEIWAGWHTSSKNPGLRVILLK
jgi:hypothetical protein